MPTRAEPDPKLSRSLPETAALLPAARALRAQDAAAPLTGAARVDLEGSALLGPGPSRSWSVGGAYLPFVGAHWQLGLAPDYAGVAVPNNTVYHNFQLAAVANSVLPAGGRTRTRAGTSPGRGARGRRATSP